MASVVIDSDQLFFNHIQLLKAVWMLRICDVTYVLQAKLLCCHIAQVFSVALNTL